MKTTRRLLAAFLVLLMCVSLFPVSAFAEEEIADVAEEVEEVAEHAEEAAVPEEPAVPEDPVVPTEEPAEPAEDPAEEEPIVPQSVEDPTDAEEPEDEVEICEDTTRLQLDSAAGTPYAKELGENEICYIHYVDATPGEEVTLWVKVKGGNTDNIQYTWYKNYGSDIISAATGSEYVFTPESTGMWMCKVTDGGSPTLYIEFHVNFSSSSLFLLPHEGTTHYVTAPEIPVVLEFDLPDGVSVSNYWFVWFELNDKGEKIGTQLNMGNNIMVHPSSSARYGVFGFREPDGPNVSITLTKHLEFFVEVVPASQLFPMEQDYYALSPGGAVTLKLPEFPQYMAAGAKWAVEEEQIPAEDNEEKVIELLDDGCTVSALGEGTAYVSLVLSDAIDNRELTRLSCRVDVTAGDIEDAIVMENYPTGIFLPETAATVNLFSTDYTRFEVLLDLENNQVDTQGVLIDAKDNINAANNNGWAIKKAWFSDDDTNAAFALRVVDDRTLEIVPNVDFSQPQTDINATVKNSYKSTIEVKLKNAEKTMGKTLVTEKPIALTVKKTLPKVTAAAVKFNSFIAGDLQPLSLSTGRGNIRLDPSMMQPDWVKANLDEMTLTFKGTRNKSYSGKLYLLVQPEGCAVEIPVAVAMKAEKSAPKLKVNGVLTVNLNVPNEPWTMVTVTPNEYIGKQILVTKITEGKKVWSAADGTLHDDPPFYCGVESSGSRYYFMVEYGSIKDLSKDHTYKVTLDLDGARTVATVKIQSLTTKPTLKLKVSGIIDTMIPNSSVTVSWNTQANPRLRVVMYRGNKEIEDVSTLFKIRQYDYDKSKVWEKTPGTVPSGYTYYLVGEFVNNGEVVASTKVKLPVKWSKSQPKITISMKASGAIDLIRPDSAVTLTVGPLKNYYTVNFSVPGIPTIPSNFLVFTYDKEGKEPVPDNQLPFEIKQVYDTIFYGPYGTGDGKATFTVTLKEGFRNREDLLPTSKYYVRVLIPAGEGLDYDISTKPIQLKLTKGKAKITPTVKTVQLLKNDRYSYADIGIAVPAGMGRIREVTLDAKSAERFVLVDNHSGNVELRLKKDNLVTTNTTVKLNVFIEGNNTGTPDAVLPISVKFA